LDEQNQQILLLEEGNASINDPNAYGWQVGSIFLRFNPINDSWIFGLKAKNKKGFNFKVDMLSPVGKMPVVQDLRPGIELLVSQTGHLNGHFRVDNTESEQFVTAKNAWFRQVWLTDNQEKNHPFSGVLCRFNDGSGFYSVNMHEPDAIQGAVTGSCDPQGISTVMSQFIQVKEEEDGHWHIRISSPKRHLILSNTVKQHSMIAGFVSEGDNSGFCVLSEDALGHSSSKPETAYA